MRTRFDQLAKDLSAAALGRGVRAGLTVAMAPQNYDLWFDPDPAEAAELAERGMLGRMAKEPFGFEAFHQAPSVGEMRECVRKHLAFHHQRELEAQAELPLAKLWVVCAGRPEAVLAAERMRRARGWPAGVYTDGAMFNVWLVVVPELPKTRATLALRLMGRGAVLKAATRELVELPVETWERQRLLPILVRWRFEIPADPAERDSNEEEFMASAQQLFETFEQQAIKRGVRLGREEGVQLGREEGVQLGREEGVQLGRKEGVQLGRKEGVQLGRKEGVQLGRKEGVQLGRKEGVVLGEARSVVTVLRARQVAVSAAAERRILACTDSRQLERWLVQAATVNQVRELFAARKPPTRSKKTKAH